MLIWSNKVFVYNKCWFDPIKFFVSGITEGLKPHDIFSKNSIKISSQTYEWSLTQSNFMFCKFGVNWYC